MSIAEPGEAAPPLTSGAWGAGTPTKCAPPSVVRTIEVQTGFEHGAEPSNQNCCGETAVNETGEKPGGTGPPIGGLVTTVVVVVLLVDVVEVVVLFEDVLADLAAGARAPPVVLDPALVVEVEVGVLVDAALPPQAASSNAPPAMATAENLFTEC